LTKRQKEAGLAVLYAVMIVVIMEYAQCRQIVAVCSDGLCCCVHK